MADTAERDAERWLADWHDRQPGVTPKAFARARPSTYEKLATSVNPGDRALDVACGDGYLLTQIAARGAASLTGIDMSDGELAAAKRRLGDRATLVNGRAQAMPFEDASFDVATSHLALMLMRPLDEVLSEVRRVLAPDGRLRAIVGAKNPEQGNAWTAISTRLAQRTLRGPALGDPRMRSEQGVRELFSAWSKVDLETYAVDLSGTPDQVWQLFLDMYLPEMMRPEDVASLEKDVRADFQGWLRDDGTIPCLFGMLEITAIR